MHEYNHDSYLFSSWNSTSFNKPFWGSERKETLMVLLQNEACVVYRHTLECKRKVDTWFDGQKEQKATEVFISNPGNSECEWKLTHYGDVRQTVEKRSHKKPLTHSSSRGEWNVPKNKRRLHSFAPCPGHSGHTHAHGLCWPFHFRAWLSN